MAKMFLITPNKIHHLKPSIKNVHKRLNYHLRIQKKWIKQYGFKPWYKTSERQNWYLMNGKFIYEEKELLVASVWMCTKKRSLKTTTIGSYWVSTVFLSLDHSYGDYPVLFETMVFENGYADEVIQYRATTYEQAMDQHEQAIENVKRKQQ